MIAESDIKTMSPAERLQAMELLWRSSLARVMRFRLLSGKVGILPQIQGGPQIDDEKRNLLASMNLWEIIRHGDVGYNHGIESTKRLTNES